ncbi:MAG: DEAD/DEAH box helicase [Planctomycetota bacterium]|nr:MAG: DEAD/DEAH box helicase [Planctomycetota bacterium]
MSDHPPLDSLTLKDLRKLAGEHQVPNRSSLNKQELLGALSSTLRLRLDQSADSPTPVKPAAAAPKAPEPEVLDPAAVAGLTNSPSKPRPPRHSQPAVPEAEAEAKAETEESGSDEPRKRKRRRRRRRGKGGNREGEDASSPQDSHASGDSETTEADNEADEDGEALAASQIESPRPTPPVPSEEPGSKAPAPIPSEPPRSAPPSNEDGVPRRGRDEARSERNHEAQRPARPARPRLESGAPHLPPVLDRLRGFSQGILELCDPDTPSWAQARLGELLAEIGVVPTPARGLPHPDFHDVIGEEAVQGVEAGHISVVAAPGFSLRGDRGDLFALRKAQVRIAPGGSVSPESSSDDQPRGQHTDTSEPAPPRQGLSENVPAPEATAPRSEEAPQDPKAATAPAQPEAERRGPTGRRGRDRPARDRDDEDAINPAAATIAEADAEAAEELAAEPPPAPVAAPGRRHRPADTAPSLPLEPVEAEELAARAKAEGFRPLGLNEQILADLAVMGYVEPSPIQAAAIPVVTTGKDLIGQALTGTGKTAAFMLPVLDRLYTLQGEGPVALVLCPTRELARQVHHETVRMAGTSGARAALIYGGVGMDDQIEALSRKPHIVIGTPGRIIDHLRRRNLDTSRINMVVLDEADQMLDIGFLPDITYILKHTPATRQTMLFSATMPGEIKKLANDYMREPEHVHVMPESVTVDKVDQKYIAVDQNKKTAVLAHFIETQKPEQMVVFCKTKHQTDRVAKVLKGKSLSAGAIHGDLTQAKREQALRQFREGKLTCLIATNVAARGLDIPSVSHVVNYDVPETPEEYVHRIGRTGRMGKEGIARTFITPEDGQFLLEIEKHIGLLLEEEFIEGITTSTAIAIKRSIADGNGANTPRLLKPIAGGIRLGRRRR